MNLMRNIKILFNITLIDIRVSNLLIECTNNEKEKNIYIIKPGEDTNRGFGI